MNNLKLSIVLFITSILIFSSCKENTRSEKKDVLDSTKVETIAEGQKNDSKKLEMILYATSFPNYMNLVLKNKEALNIDSDQDKKLTEIKNKRSDKVYALALEIKDVDKSIYMMSMKNKNKDTLLNNLEKSLNLRASLAEMKIDCRDGVLEILTEDQWKSLLDLYLKKMPFNNKEETMVLMKHVNPVPNYMQLIKGVDINLNEEQKEKISQWSKDHQPTMIDLAKKVNAIEKTLYELSMKKESKESLLNNFKQIGDLKEQIVSIKTTCRDNLINNVLTEDQWKTLVSK